MTAFSNEIAFHDDTLVTVFQRLYPILGDSVLDRERPHDLEFAKGRWAKIAANEFDLPAGGIFVRRHGDLAPSGVAVRY
jgi:hypothetical protein